MSKILSVSVAAYNVETTIKEALEPFVSCINKDKLDVMIIDDGSKDRTAEIAREYEKKYPDIFRLISKENGGWGSTINVGIREAKGKYFKQLDGDDYFSPENLDNYIEFLITSEADIVYTPFVTYEDKTGAILKVRGQYPQYILPDRRMLNIGDVEGFMPAMHTLTVKTNILQQKPLNITEHCFYTDVEFVLKSCNLCKTVISYERPIYYYRMARSGQSMSVQGIQKHYKDHLKMLKTMLQYEKKEVKSRAMKEMFKLRLEGVCDMQYKFFFAISKNHQHKKELMEYDKMLREKYPYYYKHTETYVRKKLRKTNFIGYSVLAKKEDNMYKRLKIGVYEGA